jgi:hypothetical protein
MFSDRQGGTPVGFDWNLVRDKYHQGMKINSLAGGSQLEITEVDDDKILVKSRLWRDSLTREDLETAVALLAEGKAPPDPIGFAEAMRRYQLEGEQVHPGCSRVPNMAAVVLKDLGYLRG